MPLLRGIPLRTSTSNTTTTTQTVSVGSLNVQPVTIISTTTADRERFMSGGTAVVNLPQLTATPAATSTTRTGGALQLPRGSAAAGALAGATRRGPIVNGNVTPTKAFLGVVGLKITPRQTASQIKPFEYSEDQLTVVDYQVQNDRFRQISKNGIAAFRPEILSSIDFLPIVEKARVLSLGGDERLETTPAGDFLDIQYRGSLLRQETLVRFIQTIEKANARARPAAPRIKQDLSTIRDEYEKMLREVEKSVKFFSDAVDALEFIKNSINIKSIPEKLYNTREFLVLDRFFEKKMQYSLEKYRGFSDTKILSQLLFDFRSIMEAYSISLLNLTDNDRINDFSPVTIDKTYTLTSQFTFNIASLRFPNPVGFNASEPQFFASFISSLPENPDDRIKILTLLLSKEFRVSKGLGKAENRKTLLDIYGTQAQGNPFDNIIGGIGGTIFEPATGNNSLASLLHIDLPGESQVLPFESKYVDTDDQKTVYVPGSAYFVDSIINIPSETATNKRPEFNSAPFVTFTNDYNNKVLNARKIIEDLFELNTPQSSLGAARFSDGLMTSIKTSMIGLKDPSAINTDPAVVMALFKLANTDTTLKNMLFQFALLLGMTANGSSSERAIFKALATELIDLRNLSFVKVPRGYNPNMYNGLAELRTYMETLANDIEAKVYELTTPSLSPLRRSGRITPTGPFGSPRPVLQSVSAIQKKTLGTTTAENLSSSEAKDDIFVLQVQRGSIARTLMATTSIKQDNTTNLLQEFISLVDNINTTAQTQGVSNYLLPDKSNRTRLNFISPSTQMLMFFEALSAYAKKYVFSTFETSLVQMVTSVKIDTAGNRIVFSYLEELISQTTLQFIPVFTGATKAFLGNTLRPAGVLPTTNTRFAPLTTIRLAPGGTTTAAPRQATSVNLLNQVSLEVAQAFQSSTTFNSLVSSNPSEANSLLNIANGGLLNISLGPKAFLQTRFVTLRTGLSSIRTKLADEDQTIANILHILGVVGIYLKQGADKIQGFFNQQMLASFLAENSITDLQLLQNPSQVRMAAYILDLIKEKNPATTRTADIGSVSSNIVISDVITKQEHEALLSYLSEARFLPENRADKKIKILSVGVPANFSQHLADRIHIKDITARTFRDKQFDVVNFNIYKRDARFDNIVFKPQKVIFDLSMYQLESDIVRMNAQPLEEFRKALTRARTTDYQNILTKREITFARLQTDPKYDFLQGYERQQLVINQVTSYLLGSYINLLTGMRLYEDEFLLEPYLQGTNTEARITDLVFDYLRNIQGVRIDNKATIQELLTDPRIDADAKDLLRLITYGSFVFEPDYIRASVLRPKLFDRIVHIPLDIEGFKIDEEATNATESGKLAFKSAYFQGQVQRVGEALYLKPRQEGDLIMEDYFVTIEAL